MVHIGYTYSGISAVQELDWIRLLAEHLSRRRSSVYGGKWKAGAVMLPKPVGGECRFSDTQSRVMFDSNRDIVRYLGGAQVLNKYAYNPNWPGGLALQTWYLPFPYGTEAYFGQPLQRVLFITAEAPRIGFLRTQ